jgi:hypothetical protein
MHVLIGAYFLKSLFPVILISSMSLEGNKSCKKLDNHGEGSMSYPCVIRRMDAVVRRLNKNVIL